MSGTPGPASPHGYSSHCMALPVPKEGCSKTRILELVRSVQTGKARVWSLSWLLLVCGKPLLRHFQTHTPHRLHPYLHCFPTTMIPAPVTARLSTPSHSTWTSLSLGTLLEPKVTRIAHCLEEPCRPPHSIPGVYIFRDAVSCPETGRSQMCREGLRQRWGGLWADLGL